MAVHTSKALSCRCLVQSFLGAHFLTMRNLIVNDEVPELGGGSEEEGDAVVAGEGGLEICCFCAKTSALDDPRACPLGRLWPAKIVSFRGGKKKKRLICPLPFATREESCTTGCEETNVLNKLLMTCKKKMEITHLSVGAHKTDWSFAGQCRGLESPDRNAHAAFLCWS